MHRHLSTPRTRSHIAHLGLAAAGLAVAGALFSTPLIATAAVDQKAAEKTTVALSQQGSLQSDHLGVYAEIATYKAQQRAEAAIAAANQVLATATDVDASALKTSVSQLADYKLLSSGRVEKLTDATETVTQKTADAVAAAARIANSPDGARAQAQQIMASSYGWGDDQFGCLNSLWTKESNWRVEAYNASSGATGIAQALPGEKMATVGADWQTSARTQIIWGLDYIARSYGTPCAAWSHSQSMNWY